MPYIKKALPSLVFGIILSLVFWLMPPPQSLIQASPFQILIFFIPLLLFVIFLSNIFFKFFLRSIILGFFLVLTIILQALGILSSVIFIILFLGTLLLIKFIKKPEGKRKKTKKIDTPPAPLPSILKPLKELPPPPKLKRLR